MVTTAVGAKPTSHATRAHSSAATMTGGMKLSANLSGSAEVPAGDPDATGTFAATLNPGHTQLCYELHVANLTAPTAAHIHAGAVGQNGGPVVMLAAPANGMSKACIAVSADLAQKLKATPSGYYVNVHNAEFPGGGLRGQLSR
ncbi:MAG: CHRD domain-containing protein [Novosphingobium sp.]